MPQDFTSPTLRDAQLFLHLCHGLKPTRRVSDKALVEVYQAKYLISGCFRKPPHWRCPQCGEWDSFV